MKHQKSFVQTLITKCRERIRLKNFFSNKNEHFIIEPAISCLKLVESQKNEAFLAKFDNMVNFLKNNFLII